jgi:hypothetical protein
MSRAPGTPELEALHTLLDSAAGLLRELAGNDLMQRVLGSLTAIPPDEREAMVAAIERAAVSWKLNEAFSNLHQTRLRANPNAQLFVRIYDPEEPPADDTTMDILPETLRVMRRLGLLMYDQTRAIWEPAVEQALEMLTPEERATCVRFLERALELVTRRATDGAAPGDDPDQASDAATARPRRS